MKNRKRIFSLEQRVDFLERKLVLFDQNRETIEPKPQFTVTCSRENHKEVLGLLFLDFYKFVGTPNWDDAVHDCVVATSDRKCYLGEFQTIEGWRNLEELTIKELEARVDENQRERMSELTMPTNGASEKPSWAQGHDTHSDFEPEPLKTFVVPLEHATLTREQYNAGFCFDLGGEQYLRLPDGCLFLYDKDVKGWVKEHTLAEAKPHTLTEVTEYTVGKFYHLGGDKNHYESYALCVKIDIEVSLVIPRNVSGIITIGIVSASQDDDTKFEVTPVK